MVTTAWPLAWRIAAILLGGVVLLMAGVRLTRVADTLADRTGLGEAMAAAVLLGRRDVAAGPRDHRGGCCRRRSRLRGEQRRGGIGAQTTFLALADLVYRA